MLKDYRLPPLHGGDPENMVIFLHGLGDRGDGGLLSIGRFWQNALPKTEFICPDAPFAFDMAPPDFGGRQWFSLQSFDPETMTAGVKQASSILNDYLDHILTTRKLQPQRLALVGFSQGTMMSLYVAPRRAQPIACILGYSGLLRGADTLPTEKRSAPPTMLIHGTHDDVVPFTSMAEAEQGLKAAGIPVTTLTCPGLAHSIDDRGLEAGLAFLTKHLQAC